MLLGIGLLVLGLIYALIQSATTEVTTQSMILYTIVLRPSATTCAILGEQRVTSARTRSSRASPMPLT